MIHVDNLAYIALALCAGFAAIMVALGALATWLRFRRPRCGGYLHPPSGLTVVEDISAKTRVPWNWDADPDFEWSDT